MASGQDSLPSAVFIAVAVVMMMIATTTDLKNDTILNWNTITN